MQNALAAELPGRSLVLRRSGSINALGCHLQCGPVPSKLSIDRRCSTRTRLGTSPPPAPIFPQPPTRITGVFKKISLSVAVIFPRPVPGGVASPAVGADEQAPGVGIVTNSKLEPPAPDAFHG